MKKCLSLLLILLLLLSSTALALSDRVYVDLPDETAEVALRVFVPGPKSTDKLGHFDIRIKGRVYLKGRLFVDPCLSYNGDSTLTIFSEADSAQVYRNSKAADDLASCSVYYWTFRTGNAKRVRALFRYIIRQLSTASPAPGCPSAVSCTFRKGSRFSHYRLGSVNCFYAAAFFLKGLGSDTAAAIYRAAYNGNDSILPAVLVENHGDQMTRVH